MLHESVFFYEWTTALDFNIDVYIYRPFPRKVFVLILYQAIPTFYSLPKDQILDLSQLDEFADDKTDVTQKLKFVFVRIENIVGKGENARYQHFLL